jgi:hypothetical protein
MAQAHDRVAIEGLPMGRGACNQNVHDESTRFAFSLFFDSKQSMAAIEHSLACGFGSIAACTGGNTRAGLRRKPYIQQKQRDTSQVAGKLQ